MINLFRHRSLLGCMLLVCSTTVSADVNSDMNTFFNKLGFDSNTSQPQVWQGQAAGYATGGSLYARTQVKTVQLISMTLPDINAGCGGIDAYLAPSALLTAISCSVSPSRLCPMRPDTSSIWRCRLRYRKSRLLKTSCRRWPATLTA